MVRRKMNPAGDPFGMCKRGHEPKLEFGRQSPDQATRLRRQPNRGGSRRTRDYKIDLRIVGWRWIEQRFKTETAAERGRRDEVKALLSKAVASGNQLVGEMKDKEDAQAVSDAEAWGQRTHDLIVAAKQRRRSYSGISTSCAATPSLAPC
jgi:hypothetical protein